MPIIIYEELSVTNFLLEQYGSHLVEIINTVALLSVYTLLLKKVIIDQRTKQIKASIWRVEMKKLLMLHIEFLI